MPDAAVLPEYSGTLEIDGETLQVPLPAEAHYLELADWLEDRALARIEKQRGKLSEEAFQQRYEAMMRTVAACTLAIGQPAFDMASSSLEARERLLYIVLKSRYPQVSESRVRSLFADIIKAAIAQKVAEARHAAASGAGDRPAV